MFAVKYETCSMPVQGRGNTRIGSGLLNTIIKKLPFELHIPGYQYCGPGTRLEQRLARGDRGRNKLDSYCREHDIQYRDHSDLPSRHIADRELADKAWQRVRASDASLGERIAAFSVANAMRAKVKMGAGIGSSKMALKKMRAAINMLNSKKRRKNSVRGMSRKKYRNCKRKAGKKQRNRTRVIPTPRTGGFLPLVPLFAGLSALGALGGGAAQIARAVNNAKSNSKQLQEALRHNKAIEAMALNKTGKGLYLRPYKSGRGIYLKKKL